MRRCYGLEIKGRRPERRRQETHLHIHTKQNTEPHRYKRPSVDQRTEQAQLRYWQLNHNRQKYGHYQQHDTYPVHKGTEKQKYKHHHHQHTQRWQLCTNDQVSNVGGPAGNGVGTRQCCCTKGDPDDRASRFKGAHQRLVNQLKREFSTHYDQHQYGSRPHTRSLGNAGNAAIYRAQYDKYDE